MLYLVYNLIMYYIIQCSIKFKDALGLTLVGPRPGLKLLFKPHPAKPQNINLIQNLITTVRNSKKNFEE